MKQWSWLLSVVFQAVHGAADLCKSVEVHTELMGNMAQSTLIANLSAESRDF